MASFNPGSAAVPATQVEISVSCKNLQDKDTFSKSDPMCVLKMKSFKSQNFLEVGRTEMIRDTLNPDFVKKFIVQYFFEERQMLRFEVFDVDSPSQNLDKHDFLGSCQLSLGEIVSRRNMTVNLKGNGYGNFGTISIRVEEISANKEDLEIQFEGKGLDKKDWIGKSDPFLVISRANEDNSFTVVHSGEVIKNTLNPSWRPFTLKVQTLCNGDYDRSIKIECYDWNRSGDHEIIGDFITNLRTLVKGPCQDNVYQLINHHKKAKKKSYKDSGQIHVMFSKIHPVYSFLDFIKGGMQMNFTVAIDFTASNGNPRERNSLHYIDPYRPNQYVAAIQAVGEIVEDYDSDKLFPVLGFGAKLHDGNVHHEFAVNFNPSNPYCERVAGILQAYQNCIPRIELYGPTNFSPVIRHVSKFAAAETNGNNYFVLLIITDGVITDFPQTVRAIIEASRLPMSIIIVGVGNAEFDAMDELDADNKILSSGGQTAERDIVQFVPFREFIGGRYGNDIQMSKGYLAKEVLAEIPDQITKYMKKRGIKPNPPQQTVNNVPPPIQNNPVPSSQGVAPPAYPGATQNNHHTPTIPNNPQQGYPNSNPAPGYPAQNYPGPPGNSFQGQQNSWGQTPYPSGAAGGQAPYPSGAAGGQAPYPSGPAGGQAPYNTGYPGGQAPYPSGPPRGQAPYPSGPSGGQAPYPSGPSGGQAPYPSSREPARPSAPPPP